MAEGTRPTLEVDERPERGTRATRRLRREGFVPGVVYGGTGQENAVSFKVGSRVLRTVLVPAAMHLIGDRNWWLPRGLDRVLPRVAVEGAET